MFLKYALSADFDNAYIFQAEKEKNLFSSIEISVRNLGRFHNTH